MKSEISTMSSLLVDGVFNDAKATFPGLSFDRDIRTLTRLTTERGIGVFLLDLPSLDSTLTSGLETGRLLLGSPLTGAASKKAKVPKFLSGLWLRIFSKDGALRSDPCEDAIFFIRQIACLFKKFLVPCSTTRVDKSIREYIHVDEELRQPNLNWNGLYACNFHPRNDLSFFDAMDDSVFTEYHLSDGTHNHFDKVSSIRRFQNLCDEFSELIGCYFPPCEQHVRRATTEFGVTGLRHGPGAVSIPVDEKYSFTNWSPSLRAAFPYSIMVAKPELFKEPTEVCHPSRLISVPKTAKAPRLIAAEPVENQFCQQLTLKYFVEKVRETPLRNFINFARQDLSHSLVVSSSKKGHLSTVDLSSASDRLSLWVVERCFRKNPTMLNALFAHRSKDIMLPSGIVMPLRKFASQGAAVTFPVQTIVFTLAVLAAVGCNSLADSLKMRNKVRVYGDDIIVPTYGLEDLKFILSYLQLKVNDEKSFSRGNFRESCGKDAFRGYDVTPLKVQTLDPDTPDGKSALLDQCNNAFLKGLWHTSDILRGYLPKMFLQHLPVNNLSLSPPRLRSFSGYDYSHLKYKWDRNHQVLAYKVVKFSSRESDDSSLDGGLALRAFFNERKDPYLSNGYRSSKARTRSRNSIGWVTYPVAAKAVLKGR